MEQSAPVSTSSQRTCKARLDISAGRLVGPKHVFRQLSRMHLGTGRRGTSQPRPLHIPPRWIHSYPPRNRTQCPGESLKTGTRPNRPDDLADTALAPATRATSNAHPREKQKTLRDPQQGTSSQPQEGRDPEGHSVRGARIRRSWHSMHGKVQQPSMPIAPVAPPRNTRAAPSREMRPTLREDVAERTSAAAPAPAKIFPNWTARSGRSPAPSTTRYPELRLSLRSST